MHVMCVQVNYMNGMCPCVCIGLHNTVTSRSPHSGEPFDINIFL